MRMNTMTKKILMRLKSVLLSGLFILIVNAPSFSKTVTVLNGRGLIGVYGEYTKTVWGYSGIGQSGIREYPYVYLYNAGGSANGRDNFWCSPYSFFGVIDGVTGLKLDGGDEMILVPEFTFVDERTEFISGRYLDTIAGYFSGWGSGTNEQLGVDSNCLWMPYQSTPTGNLIRHSVTLTGRMLIYGTGNQRSGFYRISSPYFGVMIEDYLKFGTAATHIMVRANEPMDIIVSGLTCTLNTPTYVNFGSHSASSRSNELLATVKNNMSVNCDQVTNKIAGTISLSGNVKPQYYSGNSLEINLLDTQQKPGAYVKMYVMVNGNKTPITVDQRPIDLAKITAQQASVGINNELVYELYSRGNNVAGKVSGSAELSIIMR
ncbi:hypothetical protein GKR67_06370 [Providencia alcalifaciens]|uniref:Fimbrial protein n=1 Tax=Providencia alcalifaciens TaxID=126385 RepID=A0AAW9V924_9GAMM|nr:hypothetical protein [Providencia alcalifaciens]